MARGKQVRAAPRMEEEKRASASARVAAWRLAKRQQEGRNPGDEVQQQPVFSGLADDPNAVAAAVEETSSGYDYTDDAIYNDQTEAPVGLGGDERAALETIPREGGLVEGSAVVESDPNVRDYVAACLQKSFRTRGCSCAFANSTCVSNKKPEGEPVCAKSVGEFTSLWRDSLRVPDVLRQEAFETRYGIGHEYKWKPMLTGLDAATDPSPFNLSLALSDISDSDGLDIRRTWDIDAFIVPIHSLAAHPEGFEICYYPRYTKMITHTWHTRIQNGRYDPRQCKHLRLGRGTRTPDWDTYIFFPRLALSSNKDAACHLSDSEQRLWVDNILIPAISNAFAGRPDILVHHPHSFDEARLKSRVSQLEKATVGEHFQTEIMFHLQNQGGADGVEQGQLSSVWQNICSTLADAADDSDLAVFKGAFLTCVTHDCKLRWRSASLESLGQRVRLGLTQQLFHDELVAYDEVWVDLAYEDTPSTFGGTSQPLTLLRRAGCNYADLQSLSLNTCSQVFNWCGLGQAGDVNAEPGSTHRLRAGGVAYVQAYNLNKCLFTGPSRDWRAFSSDNLRGIGLSEHSLRQLVEVSSDGKDKTKRLTRSSILGATKAVKQRISDTLDGAVRANFGVRHEYRISWTLLQDLSQHAPTSDEAGRERREELHLPYWVLPTSDVLDFMRWQLNRWLYPLEVLATSIVDILGQSALVSWQQQASDAATITALLDCAELCVNNGSVTRRPRLAYHEYWVDAQTRPGRKRIGELPLEDDVAADVSDEEDGENGNEQGDQARERRLGLGLATAMLRRGIAQVDHTLFNWDDLAFRATILPRTGLFRFKLKKWDRLEQNDRVDRFLAKLVQSTRFESVGGLERVREAGRAMYQLLAQSYTKHIFEHLAQQRHLPYLEKLLTEQERKGFAGLWIGLVYAALGGHLPPISYPRGTNRKHEAVVDSAPTGDRAKKISDFPNNWRTRVQLLFDWDDGLRRTWENAVFRRMARRCHRVLECIAGGQEAERWRAGMGDGVSEYVLMMPLFEDSKLWRTQKANPNLAPALREKRKNGEKEVVWIAAMRTCGPGMKSEAGKGERWEMIKSQEAEARYLAAAGKGDIRVAARPLRMVTSLFQTSV